MAEVVYALCALTSIACAYLLSRSYRNTRTRLLLWASICFGLLAANNVLLFVDLIIVPTIDLSLFRSSTIAIAVLMMVCGLVWETS